MLHLQTQDGVPMPGQGRKMQEEVLGVLRRQGKPCTAYDLLARLRERRASLAPPTIYRALTALVARGEVHRIESLNAFVACRAAGHAQGAVLSICGDCGSVEEHVDAAVLGDLSALASRSGFAPTRHVVEVHGLCATCGAAASARP